MADQIIRIQPSEFTDQVSDEGHQMTKLPYPFYVNASDGTVNLQEFWKGDPYRVVGFQTDLARHEIDLRWEDAAKDPQKAVGMYLVTADSRGGYGVHTTAVQSMDVMA